MRTMLTDALLPATLQTIFPRVRMTFVIALVALTRSTVLFYIDFSFGILVLERILQGISSAPFQQLPSASPCRTGLTSNYTLSLTTIRGELKLLTNNGGTLQIRFITY